MHSASHWSHHAAFENFMLGVTPDYEIYIREDILAEENGPMLVHGLQGLHRQQIHLASRTENHPKRDNCPSIPWGALEWRYAQFLNR